MTTAVDSRDRLRAIILGAIALVAFAPGLFWGLPTSKAVTGGLRVAAGDVPYRDFWSMYAPGQFYVQAALHRLFGHTLLVQGVLVLVLQAVSAGVLVLTARRLGVSRRLTTWMTAAFVVAFWRTAPELTTYPPALCLLLLGLDRLVAAGGERRVASYVVAGVCFGAAAWFKHDVGAYGFLAAAIAAVLAGRPRSLLPLAAGAAAVVLAAAGHLAVVAGSAAWRDLIVFPLTDFAPVRQERYPAWLFDPAPVVAWWRDRGDVNVARGAFEHTAIWAACNAPRWIFLGALAVLLARWRGMPRARRHAFLLVLATMPFFYAAAHVQQNTHPYSMALASWLVVGAAWSSVTGRWRHVLLVPVLVQVVGLAQPAAEQLYLVKRGWDGRTRLELDATPATWLSRADWEVYDGIGRFLLEHTRPDERIYVGVRRHDAIVITNQRFSAITGRLNAARHDELHPAISDREAAQREIIASIEREEVRCVVLWDFGWPDARLDAIVARRRERLGDDSVGSTVLDTWIAANFDEVMRRGEYRVLWRRGLPGPK